MHPPTASTPFFFFFRSYINTLIGGFLSVCLCVCVLVTLFRIFWISTVHQYSNWRFSVCVCVGYAFSHFSDFDDATAFLRYPPTRMHPPTASTPFSFFFRSYINTLIGGFPCVCLSVCVSVGNAFSHFSHFDDAH